MPIGEADSAIAECWLLGVVWTGSWGGC